MGAAGFIIEEKYMSASSSLDPMQLVGFEGIYATIMWIVTLIAF
jgi:hypothetical protein